MHWVLTLQIDTRSNSLARPLYLLVKDGPFFIG